MQVGVDGRLALGVDFGLLLERQCGHLLHLGLAVLELVAGLGQGTFSLVELSPGRVELAAQLPGGVETGFLRGPELLQLAAFVFGLVLGAVQHGERVVCLELELVACNGEVLYRFQLVAYGLVEVGYQVVVAVDFLGGDVDLSLQVVDAVGQLHVAALVLGLGLGGLLLHAVEALEQVVAFGLGLEQLVALVVDGLGIDGALVFDVGLHVGDFLVFLGLESVDFLYFLFDFRCDFQVFVGLVEFLAGIVELLLEARDLVVFVFELSGMRVALGDLGLEPLEFFGLAGGVGAQVVEQLVGDFHLLLVLAGKLVDGLGGILPVGFHLHHAQLVVEVFFLERELLVGVL